MTLATGLLCVMLMASWYGAESGPVRADGQPYDPSEMVAAMWGVPFGTTWDVTYGGQQVRVEIRDRGPARHLGRDMDLSEEAARRLGMLEVGVAEVKVCLVTFGEIRLRGSGLR